MNDDLATGSTRAAINSVIPDTSELRDCTFRWVQTVVLLASTAVFLAVAAQPASSAGALSLPIWEEIFDPNGRLIDRVDEYGFDVEGGNGVPDYLDQGALDAVFVEDFLSDDVATDMSVRSGAEALAQDVIHNDTVTAAHDLGNAHILASRDISGDLQIYAGVELLSPIGEAPPPDTFVEFEFNQKVVQAIGVGSPLRGERSADDLLVRIDYSAGAIKSATFQRWDAELGYRAIHTAIVAPEDVELCHGGATPYIFCGGTPPIAPPAAGYEVWDIYGTPVPSVEPDGFVEVGLDVAALLGSSPEFTSILIRTPQDIALGSFRWLGHWAQVVGVAEE